jgi:hypothetical protein
MIGALEHKASSIFYIAVSSDDCVTLNVNFNPLPDLNFYLGSNPKIVVFDPFTTSNPTCDTFTYIAQYETYFSLPSFITFDQSLRSFTIYTTDVSLLAKSYSIMVYGT